MWHVSCHTNQRWDFICHLHKKPISHVRCLGLCCSSNQPTRSLYSLTQRGVTMLCQLTHRLLARQVTVCAQNAWCFPLCSANSTNYWLLWITQTFFKIWYWSFELETFLIFRYRCIFLWLCTIYVSNFPRKLFVCASLHVWNWSLFFRVACALSWLAVDMQTVNHD